MAGLIKVGLAALIASTAPSAVGVDTGVNATAAIEQDAIALPASTWWSRGRWLAYAAPWKRGSLQQGEDFLDEIILAPRTFPNDTVIRWRWPSGGAQVRGFDHLAYGDYNSGQPREAVAQVSIRRARTLRYDFDIALNASTGEYNVLHEDFLRKLGGSLAIEIGWMHHVAASQRSWLRRQPRLQDCEDREGRYWQVYLAPSGPSYPTLKYAVFVLDQDLLVGSINKLDAYRCLIREGAMTGDEIWTGTATGVEPVSGHGSITIRHIAIHPD